MTGMSIILWACLLPGLFTGTLGCLTLQPIQGFARRLGKAAMGDTTLEIPLINVPGQRFTATHGIQAKQGEHKLFIFTVEEADANYAALSGNVALSGTMGGPDKYDMYLRYGAPPTPAKYDYKAQVTSSDSYVGEKLYSRDIRIERPRPGQYYLLITANQNVRELLVTAIVDTPPDLVEPANKPGFTIQRMGKYQR